LVEHGDAGARQHLLLLHVPEQHSLAAEHPVLPSAMQHVPCPHMLPEQHWLVCVQPVLPGGMQQLLLRHSLGGSQAAWVPHRHPVVPPQALAVVREQTTQVQPPDSRHSDGKSWFRQVV
jgi:hypothetical protein